MSMPKNIILCSEISEFEKIRGNTRDILCLTKNPRLYDHVIAMNEDISIKYLEPAKTYIPYTDKAKDIVEWINNKIMQACKTEKTYLYTIGMSFDVGETSAQIRKAIIVWDMLNNILGELDIKTILCCYHKEYIREIEGLKIWAMRKKCPWKLVNYDKKDLEYLRLCFNGKGIGFLTNINAKVQHLLRFFCCNTKKEGAKARICSDVGLVKLGARQKDYNWTKDYLNMLEQSNISFRIICMNESNSEQWRKWGYDADNLQSFVTYGGYCRAALKYMQEKKRIWRAVKKDVTEFSDEALDSEQLMRILMSHLNYDVFDNVIIDCGAYIYFQSYMYRLIDYNVSTNYISSKICYFNARKFNAETKFKAAGAEARILPLGSGFGPFDFICDFRFVSPYAIKEGMKSYGRIYPLTKSIYTDDFLKYQFNYDNLYDDFRVLWAPSYPEMGVTRYSSFRNAGEKLLETFKYNIGNLYIKFHPNQRVDEVANFVKECELYDNIEVFGNLLNIKEALDKADICITNCSLTIIDAAVRKKAVICVVDSIEYELVERHKAGICIITDVAELENLLKNLAQSTSYRKKWISEQIEKQNSYFSQFLSVDMEKGDMISIIKKELNEV